MSPREKEIIHNTSVIQPQIMVFSAKDSNRLQTIVQQMLEFIEHEKEFSLADLAYMLQVGREAMESRLAMVVNNRGELVQGLNEYLKSLKEGNEIAASIPIFTGDLTENHSGFRSLLSGKLGENVVQMLLEEKNFEKIAIYWSGGGKIPWELLHEGQEVQKISLPTYPFEKRRCWSNLQFEQGLTVEPNNPLNSITSVTEINTSLKDRVVNIISGLLGMTVTELNLNKPLSQYGVDSIILMSLFQHLQTQIDPSIDLIELQKCGTIQDIINLVRSQNSYKEVVLDQQTSIFTPVTKAIPATWPQFPELIHLNQSHQGRPVFWIHPGVGGVESYQAIAQKSSRPFYGIQARGFMTDRSPLYGLQAMATYYVKIIQTVQPEGPYDLGGYSLGGNLAYEVVRQLQEMKQTVSTIVMVDTFSTTEFKKAIFTKKSADLQAINRELMTISKESGKIALIHRDEVDVNLEEEAFLQQLITLAQKRGLKKTNTQLQTNIQHIVRVQGNFTFENYFAMQLPDPHSINCYYFRNKSEIYCGNMEPYFYVSKEGILDHTNYWAEWKNLFPNFHMMDVDASSHFEMLSEPKAAKAIENFCQELYSKEKISEFLKLNVNTETTIETNTKISPQKNKITKKKVKK